MKAPDWFINDVQQILDTLDCMNDEKMLSEITNTNFLFEYDANFNKLAHFCINTIVQ